MGCPLVFCFNFSFTRVLVLRLVLVYLAIWFCDKNTLDLWTLGKVWLFAAGYRRSADLQEEHDKDSILHQDPDGGLTAEGKDNKINKASFHLFASEVCSQSVGAVCVPYLCWLSQPEIIEISSVLSRPTEKCNEKITSSAHTIKILYSWLWMMQFW